MKIQQIWTYPVKSCQGYLVEEMHLDRFGIQGDRRWMLIDPDGRFLSQREHTKIALIKARMEANQLSLEVPGQSAIKTRVPFEHETTIPVQVWDDEVKANLADTEASEYLSNYLGQACRLVYFPYRSERQIDLRYAEAGKVTSFTDGYPLMILSQASLDDLNQKLKTPLPMNRFRPNLVVEGSEAFAEDQWKEIQIGDIRFSVVKPCARCIITTIDQRTGEKGKEPLATLATYRKAAHKILFGQNLIHQQEGSIKVGAEIKVIS